ncbi:hypothetical protein O181_051504 [Austropuccinia psidii MF-1]|uniref:Uncharacterized protein n=1 Tax=Austropuccinia psidii MF-1 TaxID=1389203 RepID=A0A9Q3DYV3_9BASI|nr:hypothetical protein [Austropuccinia psidii MF-1]
MKLRQAHGQRSWTWWKNQIIKKWANDAWRFEVETACEYAKFNSDKDKPLKLFCQQKFRLKELYPEMSKFMDHRKILRQCGEEVSNRTGFGSSSVNLKTMFNTPWNNSVDKNPKENSNIVRYKSADTVRKCHIFQSTTHLANKCPQRGKINEINIKKEPDVEKEDNIIEENSYDKSSIFSASYKNIENIYATFDIMESYSHLPQLRNGQLAPAQISRQSSAIDFTSHCVGHITSASRQRQSSHVSHDNVTQSPNPFQHYSQCLGNFTSLASASPPNQPRRFACLRARTTLQMRLQHFPPISVLTTPYAFTAPPLPSLCSQGVLPTCSQHHLHFFSALPTPLILTLV